MVRIEIPDRHPLRAIRERVESGESDVAEITKPHSTIARRVMTRWAHQTEGATPLYRLACHVHCRTRRPCGMSKDPGINRRVRIEIERRVANPSEMLA
jgi:hypothetical protein